MRSLGWGPNPIGLEKEIRKDEDGERDMHKRHDQVRTQGEGGLCKARGEASGETKPPIPGS